MAQTVGDGVFVLPEALGRGFDLKFSTDAHVIVCDPTNHFKCDQIKQMIGRSSRSQNI